MSLKVQKSFYLSQRAAGSADTKQVGKQNARDRQRRHFKRTIPAWRSNLVGDESVTLLPAPEKSAGFVGSDRGVCHRIGTP